MIFTFFLNFNNEFSIFNENFFLKQNIFSFENVFLYLVDFTQINFIFLNKTHTSNILNFINQTEDVFLYNNLENIKSIYHYSIPNTKLAYPEPFIASASMMHSDLWFIHILIYQYWLWFVFVFLIIFFFITFVCTIRWCNMRIRPRRETRGVSRSKCGDLITATVPVSWATSIIVHESTDAIDFYDGFGTSELVVGVRAYQWGWEYYYPKDIDLNYNIKNNYSTFVGNSLKYDTTTDLNLKTNNMWKYYQNKSLDQIVTPAHLLFLPIDNFKLLNFLNFNDVGSNPLNETTAFKKIKMFSKVHSYNLIATPINLNSYFKKLNFFFSTENDYAVSLYLGLKRQHNFLNNSSLVNYSKTFFNLNSLDKWLSFNFNFTKNLFFDSKFNNFLNFFKKNSFTKLTANELRISTFFNNYHFFLKNFNKFVYAPSIVNTINDDSDKSFLTYPIYKINNIFKNNVDFDNNKILFQTLSKHDLTVFRQTFATSFIKNTSKSYKNFSIFSPSQSILTSSKNLRNFVNISPNVSSFNHDMGTNAVSNYENFLTKNTSIGNFFFYNLNYSNWPDLNVFNKLASNRVYFDSPFSPIISNNPNVSSLNYDNYRNTFIENSPTALQGKEEQIPSYLLNTYWNFYWNSSETGLRIKNNLTLDYLQNKFYLPLFNIYYDYDFRNWQSLELFEDSFWENTISSYALDDYISMVKDFYNYILEDKLSMYYYKFDNLLPCNDKIIFNSLNKKNINQIYYASGLYFEDQLNYSGLNNFNNLFTNQTTNLLYNIEDSYESIKFINYFYNLNFKTSFITSNANFSPLSHTTVFDAFRSDYDEFSWYFDDKNLKKINNFFYTNHEQNFSHCDFNFLNSIDYENLNIFNFFRFNDYMNLRSPVKNSIVTYNAMQKVFKARFDEGRSNTDLLNYSSSYYQQTYVTSSRYKYEKLLTKNKENFFNVNFYKTRSLENFNYFYNNYTSLNFYNFDFPFLLAMKSDASRYLWFDWFAKWGFYEVQPSSTSRYAIYGMPYFNKNFEFNTQLGEVFTESETYFLRLARIRRNYLPNWTYTPYLYNKSINWFKNNLFFEILSQDDSNLFVLEHLLNCAQWYWNDIFILNQQNSLFTPTFSNINSYAKSFWKPQTSIQSYYYSISVLSDILSKREYLYREFLNINNKIVNIPNYLTASPTNPLLNELKSVFLFIDPIAYNNEYSRDVYFNSLNYFNFNSLRSVLFDLNDSFNLSVFSYLFSYLTGYKNYNSFDGNVELFQNQYRPMKKGITNMIRLHATGAIAMPIEIKLQLLASSKDVIHSWAIPSAGIKIDCVPGYSSHKVTIFLVSGIFWGQCMEICGRYHHWMPIVIYFMKRDLFFLWCTHFVFLTGANNMWNINDRQFTNYVRTASFDKLSWLSELNNF